VAAYGLAIARASGIDVADEPQMEFGFLLHDIGKVGVPDAILFKPAALSHDEYERIASHAEIGSKILRHVDFLEAATLVVRHHHERWDGTGYPDGLKGEQIPLAARVFAVADTLDALTTDRPYRDAIDWQRARVEIHNGSGTQFDPAVIAAYDTIGDDTFARLGEGIRSPSRPGR
jgi:HD-GYP domain-containing protein (c-di-GMP phosphodiesterase class II)